MVIKTVSAEDVPMTYRIPHRERLTACLRAGREAGMISLNLATYWATRRRGHEAGTGCLIGHYVKSQRPRHLDLVPLNFLEQVKSPLHMESLWTVLPNADWRHHELHYHGPDIEAWGLSAACLYFQIRPWDAQTLFWPAGYWPASYTGTMQLDPAIVLAKLDRFLKTERAMNNGDNP